MFRARHVLEVVLIGGLCLGSAAPAGDTSAGGTTTTPVPAVTTEWTWLDVDGNGSLSATELAQGQLVAAMLQALDWNACDADHDGTVTRAEYQAAAFETLRSLRAAADPADEQAEQDLAAAVSLEVLLEQLGASETYAAELAALREAVANLGDEDTVVTHVITNPARYPHLGPLVRAWVRYYPVKPELRRHVPAVRPHVGRPAGVPPVHRPVTPPAHIGPRGPVPTPPHATPGVSRPTPPAHRAGPPHP
jgi:hypothetical protein